MWQQVSSFLIRNRLYVIGVVLILSAFFGYQATRVELSYDFPQIVPMSDPDYTFYRNIQKEFGEDGNLIIIGFEGHNPFELKTMDEWLNFASRLKKISGVDTVASIQSLVKVNKNTELHKFVIQPLFKRIPQSQLECDSIKAQLDSLPFYNNLIYNPETKATFLAITMTDKTLRSKSRKAFIEEIESITQKFTQQTGIKASISGLPYIRTIYGNKINGEIKKFLILSVLITSLILILFFRGLINVIFPLLVIGIVLVWTLGFMGILGYKITLLTALIPPLVVVIGMPNFIYFVNAYHQEYKKENNKVKAIHRMVEGIAFVVFMNNTTTAIGFGAMVFVDSPILREFGIISFLMIVFMYLLMTILMPIVFYILDVPKERHIKYLDNRWMNKFLNTIDYLAIKKPKQVLLVSGIIGIISIIGIYNVKALGYILDDVPKSDKLYTDLQFYERNFKGIMPLEVVIDTKKPKGILNLETLSLISKIQDSLETIPEFGNTTSIADVVKFANQSYKNGNPSAYRLPYQSELVFMMPYIRGLKFAKGGLGSTLIDSIQQKARITSRITDAGSLRLAEIEKLVQNILSYFLKDSKIESRITGYSLIFLRGNHYLIENLFISLAIAIAAITIALGFLFKSMRLVFIVLIPNFLALAITMAIMGYLHLYLKPSSVLVFSIAFGIAIDASFHYIVKYRLAVKNMENDRLGALSKTILETGFSLVYTTIVLFFGFGIFCFSNFGSTIALGALTAITLFCALFTNIILIPVLLKLFDKQRV